MQKVNLKADPNLNPKANLTQTPEPNP